jgi:hypothetical protein
MRSTRRRSATALSRGFFERGPKQFAASRSSFGFVSFRALRGFPSSSRSAGRFGSEIMPALPFLAPCSAGGPGRESIKARVTICPPEQDQEIGGPVRQHRAFSGKTTCGEIHVPLDTSLISLHAISGATHNEPWLRAFERSDYE